MKKTLFSLFTAVSLALLYCPAAFALTEDEAAATVDAQGKDAVSGNLFLWLLCAITFMKVSTKLDGINMLKLMYLVIPFVLDAIITFILSRMKVEEANDKIRNEMKN